MTPRDDEWQTLDIPAIALTDLSRIRSFVRGALDAGGATDVADAVALVVDEVCANLVMHGFGDDAPGRVVIGICLDDDVVRLTIEDAGRPFHPDAAPAPDVDSDWDARRVGGLGWFFVRELMDECRYEAGDGSTGARLNRLTLAKRRGLSASDASGNTSAAG